MAESKSQTSKHGVPSLGLAMLVLVGVLSFLFFKAFLPGNVLFSNDGPLGAQMAECHRVPDSFSGGWQDLNTVGFREAGAFPGITFGLLYLLGPIGFSKAYAAIALLILGLGAWSYFRQLGLSSTACVLGSLGTVLNSTFFSVATWGVAAQAVTMGMIFFALAALADTTQWFLPPGASPRAGAEGSNLARRWLRVVLAGLAVGMAVAEGADVGAIFSIYLAAFVVYQAVTSEGPQVRNLASAIGRVTIIAAFAGFLAAHTISVLVGTQIKGVAGAEQDTQSKWERWDWATQWSLPKREALGLVVPGAFGYRMDTPVGLPEGMSASYKGGQYWGFVGLDPSWYRYWNNQGPQPGGAPRGFSGGGIYAGTLVVLVAIWAAVQSLRQKDSVYSLPARRLIWFFTGVVLISLPLAFGRFAPFYKLLYALPYFSTIRNPGKFLSPLSWAIVILFAFGVEGLWRRYMQSPAAASAMGIWQGFTTWWRQTKGFDKKWTLWTGAVLVVSAVACLIFAGSDKSLEQYLQGLQYDPGSAAEIASFCIGQVGRSLLFFGLAVVLVTFVLSGVLSGQRAKWGAMLMGLFLVADLGRANQPWIIVWDYETKYARDPVIDLLRQKPYEQRVAAPPRWFTGAFQLPPDLAGNEAFVGQYYSIEWAQHHFLYYDIQSLDLIQMPRMPEDLLAYDMNFYPRSGADLPLLARKWELTNTRYIIAATEFGDLLNRAVDPGKQRFRVAERFTLLPRPGITKVTQVQDYTAVATTNGPFAVLDFTGALPRAKLYTRWELAADDRVMLGQLQANLQLLAAQQATNGSAARELRFIQHIGTNDYLTLKKLVSPSFDPEQTVLLAKNPVRASGASSNAQPGKVEITSYASKRVVLKAQATAPGVLLLNDRYEGNWRVFVDGKQEELLRCNYIMRGVFLNPGDHVVEFKFQPSMRSFYISLTGVILGVALCGMLLVWRQPQSKFSAAIEPTNKAPSQQPEAAGKRKV